jgi:hypothetical protein
LFDPDKTLSKNSQKEMDLLLYSEPRKVKTKVGAKDINLTFQGVIEKFAYSSRFSGMAADVHVSPAAAGVF